MKYRRQEQAKDAFKSKQKWNQQTIKKKESSIFNNKQISPFA